MVGCFFREDLGVVSIFQRERDLGFRLFCGDSEFRCCGKLGNEWEIREEAFAITTENPVDLAIVQGMLEVLILRVMVEVVIEVGIIDSVYVDMTMGSGKGFSEKGVVPLGIGGVGNIEVL